MRSPPNKRLWDHILTMDAVRPLGPVLPDSPGRPREHPILPARYHHVWGEVSIVFKYHAEWAAEGDRWSHWYWRCVTFVENDCTWSKFLQMNSLAIPGVIWPRYISWIPPVTWRDLNTGLALPGRPKIARLTLSRKTVKSLALLLKWISSSNWLP